MSLENTIVILNDPETNPPPAGAGPVRRRLPVAQPRHPALYKAPNSRILRAAARWQTDCGVAVLLLSAASWVLRNFPEPLTKKVGIC